MVGETGEYRRELSVRFSIGGAPLLFVSHPVRSRPAGFGARDKRRIDNAAGGRIE